MKLTESKVCMKMALQQNVGSMNSDDINKLFPILHEHTKVHHTVEGSSKPTSSISNLT